MNELLKQNLYGPVSLSLLEYKGNVMDIELVLNMTDSEIDPFYYFKEVVDTSSPDDEDEKDGEEEDSSDEEEEDSFDEEDSTYLGYSGGKSRS